MKKILHFLFLVLCLFFAVSCEEEKVSTDHDKGDIVLDNSSDKSIEFSDDRSEKIIYFTASGSWRAKIEDTQALDWLSVSPEKGGRGQKSITITAEPNDDAETRSACVAIKIGNKVCVEIKVTQMQKDALVVVPENIQVGQEGGDISIEVGHNVNFSITIGVDWIKQKSTRAYVKEDLIFTVSENSTLDNRDGIITFTSNNGNITQSVRVYQTTEDAIVVSPREQNFNSDEHTFDIGIKANVEYSVSVVPPVSWLHRITTRSVTQETLHYRIDANDGVDARKATIKVISTKENVTDSVLVMQMQKDALVIAKSDYTVEASGGEITVGVGHNVDFDIDIDVNWISQKSTRAYIEEDLVFAVAKNSDNSERNGKITFTSKDGSLKQTVNVIQLAGSGGGGVEGTLSFTVGEGENAVTFNMVPVEGGTFQMGSNDGDSDEKPVHQVTLSSYYMGETEVTQALWYAVMGQRPTSDGSQWSSSYGMGDNYPAYYTSWNSIQGFLTALNAATASQRGNKTFAMPTEAQWEFAARGGNQSHGYKYAGSNSIGDVAWYAGNSSYKAHPVKGKLPNELGLYDMSGNVYEWCKDRYGSYDSGSQNNPEGPASGSNRVMRGGCWDCGTGFCRISHRRYFTPDHCGYDGLRLALSDGFDTPPATVPVTGVSLDKTTLTLTEGESATLTATVTPEDATNQNVSWKSDNTSVATVDAAGKVIAVKAGSATITVTTEDGGKTATCAVTVTSSGGGVEGTLSFTVNGVTFEMKPVQGGTFWMGAQKDDPDGQNYDEDARSEESPVHQVTLSDYYMGETEVTQALWYAVMGQRPTSDGEQWGSSYGMGDNYPAYFISWEDIQGFLTALNAATASQRGDKTFAMPTEAQWEFAARGGNSSHGYKYAGSNNIDEVAWYDANSDSKTHPVKGKLPNELDLFDMNGNVWEWCKDWYEESYGSDSQNNPAGPTTGWRRVVRGSCYCNYARDSRVSERGPNTPDFRFSGLGFRLALSDGSDTPPATVPVTGVSLDKTTLTLQEGESATLTATVSPSNATNKNVTWGSNNTAVATVDNEGKVTAVKAGSATITVTTEDGGKTATCTVTVIPSGGGVEGALSFTVGEGENAVTFNMVPVKGGTFRMGAQSTNSSGQNYDADAYSNESPVHQVTLSDYYIGQTEVTQGLWKAVMGSNPSYFKKGDNYPIEQVNWTDICGMDGLYEGFLDKLNAGLAEKLHGKKFVLPTEAQWEFAARGGTKSNGYKYSGSDILDEVGWYEYEDDGTPGNSDHTSHPVGTKRHNELGIYDMSGNVWEWCADRYGDYGAGPDTDPTGPETGSDCVIRGGGWDYWATGCRVSYRTYLNSGPGDGIGYLGFRLALSDGFDTPPATVPVTGVSLDKMALTLKAGESATLTATVTPENATNKNVTWVSNNTSVATVDAAGKVTAVSAGSATITVTTEDGGKTATCTVTVTPSSGGGVEGALTFTANGVTFNMIPVTGGTFWMGAQKTDPSGQNYDADAYDSESPVHQVTLSSYYMGETEVTQALWQAVMGNNPSFNGGASHENYPVDYVSWNDICDTGGFLEKLNAALSSELGGKHFALPTEAQWEFAARGGNQSHGYKYAGSDNIEDVAWYYDNWTSGNSGNDTHPVKGKSPNELGLYDMSGNVWEWCADWYGSSYYSSSPSSNPTGPESGDSRVERGGSACYGARHSRVSDRSSLRPSYRYNNGHGFRLALSDGSDTPPATVPVTGVSLDKMALTLKEGESATLTATVTPENATNKKVTWGSNNTTVATVDNAGKVTAVSAGSATITVTTEDGGKTATCTVTVIPSGGGVEGALSFTVNGVTFSMIPVEAGTFKMGGNVHSDEKPVHQVTLTKNYYIGKFEVTQGLWQAVMGNNPSNFKNGGNYPVEQVSWDDICNSGGFLDKLNAALAAELSGMRFALPTEAQWEFAAAGGKAGYNADGTHKHTYAGSNTVGDVAWYGSNSGSKAHEVGNKAANELGIYDMSGNVWEWCADWYGAYGAGPDTDPTGPATGSARVIRGGGWNDVADYCQVSNRGSARNPDYRSDRSGFRLALSEGAGTPPATVPVTGVSLDKTTLTLKAGESATLTATVTPENATNKNVTWKSDNTSVVTVDAAGKVTAVKAGSATITVTTDDGGKTATCTVTVTPSGGGGIEGALSFTVGTGANTVTFEMIPVEAGTFWMGTQKTDVNGHNYDANAYSNETPVHQVTLTRNYYIGKFEVTQGLWKAVMGNNPSNFKKGDDYPVEKVKRNDICDPSVGFLKKLNEMLASQLNGKRFVLPTEAQWEFAAGGGNAGHNADGSRRYIYSGSDNIEAVGWYRNNSSSQTHPVGRKQPNELGIYDMSGNVCEWCADRYGAYGIGPDTDPTGPATGSSCIFRGGGWRYVAGRCTVSDRDIFNDNYYDDGGFRLALSEGTGTPPVTVPVTGVSLDKTTLTLAEGESYTLTAIISPSNATNKNVTWKSDNTYVATVSSSGKVTAVSAGSATITVKTEDGGKTATCTVTVTPSGGSDTWEGTWSATFEKQLRWEQNAADEVVDNFIDKPITVELSIEYDAENDQYLIYGWSQVVSEIPAHGLINDETGDLEVYSGVAVGETGEDGYTPTWLAYSYVQGGYMDYYFVTGQFPAYIMSRDGDAVNIVPCTGKLTDGTPFTISSLDIYGDSDDGVRVYAFCDCLAGAGTMTKTSSSPAAEQMNASSVGRPVNLRTQKCYKVQSGKALSVR